ncbi:MAG: DUF2202 domain-containing protein [Gemmatimonadota bacterium]|jgi:rubrerythrin
MPTIPRRVVPLVAALVVLTACDEDNVFPTTPSVPQADAAAALTRAIQSEYRAENIYLRVLVDFGSVEPFESIAYSEPRHSATLAYLFVARDLAVPASEWTLNNVQTYDSVEDACAAAAAVEQDNIAMYDELLALNLPDDVLQAFGDNRASSEDDRLPAFEACG